VRTAWRCYSSLVVTAFLLASCAAGQDPGPSPSLSTSPSPSLSSPSASPAAPSIPADGVTLAFLGFTNGPGAYFSVPRAALITDRVDQPNAVTIVMTRPTADELASYYRRALPSAGFHIDRDDAATATLTFSGHGWQGAFTGADNSSAVFLRPA
jgi:hypothetical protein